MGFNSQVMELDLECSKKEAFDASVLAMATVGHKIATQNELMGMIRADVKPGLTSATWGDTLTVTIAATPTGCHLKIDSTAKAASLLGGKQQAKNIDGFVNALSSELTK